MADIVKIDPATGKKLKGKVSPAEVTGDFFDEVSKKYTHYVNPAAAEVTITHNKGKRPQVWTLNTDGQEFDSIVIHSLDENSFTVHIAGAKHFHIDYLV